MSGTYQTFMLWFLAFSIFWLLLGEYFKAVGADSAFPLLSSIVATPLISLLGCVIQTVSFLLWMSKDMDWWYGYIIWKYAPKIMYCIRLVFAIISSMSHMYFKTLQMPYTLTIEHLTSLWLCFIFFCRQFCFVPAAAFSVFLNFLVFDRQIVENGNNILNYAVHNLCHQWTFT